MTAWSTAGERALIHRQEYMFIRGIHGLLGLNFIYKRLARWRVWQECCVVVISDAVAQLVCELSAMSKQNNHNYPLSPDPLKIRRSTCCLLWTLGRRPFLHMAQLACMQISQNIRHWNYCMRNDRLTLIRYYLSDASADTQWTLLN